MTAPKNRAPLPSRYTSRARAVRRDYVREVESGVRPVPTGVSKADVLERKSLASLASKARWGKAPKGIKIYGRICGTKKKTKTTRS